MLVLTNRQNDALNGVNMGIKKKTKSYPATRKFVLRRDASVASGIKEIERVFGLPEGSVR